MTNMEKPITRRKVLLYALLHNHQEGLCKSIRIALDHFNAYVSTNNRFISYVFPLFTYENATKFGADKTLEVLTWYLRWNHIWWARGWWIFTGRLRFHLWLLKEYWNDETDLKQVCLEFADENFRID